jgi:P-type conjugative transfer protein TrbJ
MRKALISVKLALIIGTAIGVATAPANAQFGAMAVFDVANTEQSTIAASQSTITATQAVAAVAKQIQQYQTQLQQYENQLRNTVAPASYIWAQSQSAIDGLQSAVNTLNVATRSAGGVDSFLKNFNNEDFYRSSPCFAGRGCSRDAMAAFTAARRAQSASTMATNASVLRGINDQQDKLKQEAATLEMMQVNAQSADGQAQALGYANQFAANEANQLIQIRGLLVSQQAAETAIQQAQADQTAVTSAASAQARSGSFSKSQTSTFAW